MLEERFAIRVLFTHPYFWPHVRRGAERTIAELGSHLVRRDNRVHLLTTSPAGVTSRTTFDGMSVRYARMTVPQWAARRGWGDVTAFAAYALPADVLSRADVLHAWHYGDAWAAVQSRRIRRRPVVMMITGTVIKEQMERIPIDRRMFREALGGADEVWVYSEFARAQMADFGVPMHVVPGGVDLDRFSPRPDLAPEPTVFCAAAPEEPRKRLVDVVDAWPAVLDSYPTARLRLAGRAPDATQAALLDRIPPKVRESVRFLGSLDDAQLAAENATAWAALSPGLHEAFGLVTLEALASGTPVAAVEDSASPELLTPETGTFYRVADPDDCARSVIDALELSTRPDTSARCRARAELFSWGAMAQRVEARYRALLKDSA